MENVYNVFTKYGLSSSTKNLKMINVSDIFTNRLLPLLDQNVRFHRNVFHTLMPLKHYFSISDLEQFVEKFHLDKDILRIPSDSAKHIKLVYDFKNDCFELNTFDFFSTLISKHFRDEVFSEFVPEYKIQLLFPTLDKNETTRANEKLLRNVENWDNQIKAIKLKKLQVETSFALLDDYEISIKKIRRYLINSKL